LNIQLNCQLNNNIDVEVTSAASDLRIFVKFPHRRRVGVNQLVGEVDDIFTLITFLDGNKLFCELPKYVANGADNMLTLRIDEGETGVLTAVILDIK